MEADDWLYARDRTAKRDGIRTVREFESKDEL